MSENLYISGFCQVTQNCVTVNGITVFEADKSAAFPDFIKEAYKHIGMAYPKFFKMDSLSKLGVATVEFLLNTENKPDTSGEKTGIVLVNSTSSLDTDKSYQKTIANKTDYFPSPAVFVYTLPNIVIGEICIKHKITGESIFFVSEAFDENFLYLYTCDLIKRQGLNSILLGWVDYLDNEYISLFCLVKKSVENEVPNKHGLNFTVNNLKDIFKSAVKKFK
jgi:hypothetical protein